MIFILGFYKGFLEMSLNKPESFKNTHLFVYSMNIEAEVRSFVSKDQYDALLRFLLKNSKLVKDDYQETYYFDSEEDLRIQRNNFYSKIWLKKGKIHDDHREEFEIKFDKDHFEDLERLFLTLGFQVEIKWFRKRKEFSWNGIKVCLDFTKGYGYIIELEKMCSEENKEKELELLKQKLKELNVELTPKQEFDEKFKYYKENWKTLVQ
jgi:predicted adenylyl cyclase CyaB